MQRNPCGVKAGDISALSLIDTLDALSFSIAIVDSQGSIRHVNRAWRQFAAENSADSPDGWVGASYLDVCDAVIGEDRPTARAFADAARSILQGELDFFQLEYPCHSPEKQRWFAGKITPLPANGELWAMASHEDITERKRGEEERAKLAAVVQCAGELVNLATLDGQMTFINEAGAKMLGIDSDHVDRVNIMEVIPDHLRELVEKELLPELLRGGVWMGDLQYRNLKTGQLTDVFANTFVVRDPGSGAPAFLANVSQDITDRKRAEEALESERLRLAGIIEGTHVGTWEWNVRTGASVYNERWAEIIGYTLDEISPVSIETWMKFVHPDDIKGSDKQLEAHFRGELAYYDFESRMKHKNGEWVWVHDRGKVVSWTEDGKPLMMLGTHQDITDRKREEEELAQLSRQNELILESAGEGIYGLDLQGRITFANPAGANLLGYSLVEMIGHSQHALIHHSKPDGSPYPREDCPIYNAFKDGKVHRVDTEVFWRKDGMSIPVDYISAPIRNESGEITGAVVVFRDITDRIRAEEEKEKLQSQLNQAQKMESVGRLAGGVAHDFNNMLGVILGHTEMALEQATPGQPLFADLLEIRQAAQRSADLTRQLLTFARKQTVAPKALDLNETVEGMLKLLRRLIGEDIDLAWLPGKSIAPVRVDPSQLDQILANLCVNARDAIAGVGKITIETDAVTFDEAYCAEHVGFVPGEFVLLAVSDNGCGMDKETLGHLFEPFFTTKELGKGTGLGLASVYGAVKQNNGFINVYSEPGQGTTFKIYLPRHEAKTDQPVEKATEKAVARGNETVLLVEDEPAILSMVTKMIERGGYTVIAAGTPGEAIRLAREHTGPIHLLITDVVMPEMNGRDLARNLMSIHPDIKRLFMSGYTAKVIAHHGVLDPGVHFIQKPFSMKELAVKVQEALNRE